MALSSLSSVGTSCTHHQERTEKAKMESSQMTTISPHPPSSGSFSTSAGGGRHGAVVCPHLVGVTTSRDLELLGVLPGLVVPDRGQGYGQHSSATVGARESMMSMFR